MMANLSVNRTVGKLRLPIPSALRAPAAGYLKRWASLKEDRFALMRVCTTPKADRDPPYDTCQFAARAPLPQVTRRPESWCDVAVPKKRERRIAIRPTTRRMADARGTSSRHLCLWEARPRAEVRCQVAARAPLPQVDLRRVGSKPPDNSDA